MAPSSSPERVTDSRELLLDVARRSVERGVREGAALEVDPKGVDPALREERASFVTLRRNGALRGCVGSLDARRPLVIDVATNAFAAAFEDHRFPQLQEDEMADLEIEVSVLSPLEAMRVESEDDLILQLRPGIDGLVLHDGPRRATFLPAVWEKLADPREFVRELKRKAGLPRDHWSVSLSFERYTVESLL